MTNPSQQDTAPAKPELDSQYHPIGLKAVIAAALMLKRKPAKKAA
ncbi:hypothetical protein ACQ3G6_13445 [Allorhizobium undicola]|nr:hypothetical protein [Allorhizobium undicola]